MTKKRLLLLVLALIVAAVGIPISAQSDPAQDNPNAQITWPPPVYVLRGEFEIRGSANVPNMANFFIEFRPLDEQLQPPAGREVWFPASLPNAAAVQDDVLAVWDTSVVPDGIYELRLTVNVTGGTAITDAVGPVRLENTPPPFAPVVLPTNTPVPQVVQPTTPPQPTAIPTEDPTPRVTISTPTGNVRQGDGTNYNIIVTLTQGTVLDIVGISTTGSGWYNVRLPNGSTGWVAPSIVTVSGNVGGLPRVQPPPPPATPVPTPVPFTATPTSSANLVAGIVVLEPATPTCGQTFNVGFDVANLGSTASSASGTVSLVDVRAADGSTQGTTIGGFPILSPGQTFRVVMPLTVSTWYNETHRITLIIDPSNAIPENNETDQQRVVEYVLQKGSCP
ncbi:MAG: SH3 domain-containing protein [Chloroflexi bacterium]|jgi:uncharacterized protein YgiM (DUF1202 family)|uniref:SH3 domain-containing protein n=1 Tax=Candidatus Flexifilum breve TaxID=3140694 RepID=UPI0031349A82|nr:SH3 domain-containing protein [Chloroflexota bacterium]